VGKSMSGIDWIDVATLMNGLEGIHEVKIEWTVSTLTRGDGGLLDFTACAWVPTVEPQVTREIARISGTWPDKDRPTFDGYVFNKLYELDKLIGRVYAQKELPE
jgi:hypothetical protein